MDRPHRLLLTRATVVGLALLHAAIAACRPTVASIHLVNATSEQAEASIELAGKGARLSTIVLLPNERHFFLKYDQRSDASAELTALVKRVTFKQRDCVVARRGDGILELASRNPDHAGWMVTFRRSGQCRAAEGALPSSSIAGHD